MSDIGNKAFQAIETIIGQRLSEMNFDTTIICTIIDDKDKDKGRYRAKNNENLTFDVYCNAETKYSKNDQVYVLIPQGDYSNEKTIVNKYFSDGETAIAFVPTDERILKDSDASLKPVNSEAGSDGIYTIYANYTKTGGEEYEKNGKYIRIYKNWLQGQNYSGFNTLNIKADIQCSLKEQYSTIKSGIYGIQVSMYVKTASGNLKRLVYKFNSNQDMYGDPYAYYIYGTQEQNFSFEPTDIIQYINVYLYQNQAFKDKDGTISYNTNYNAINFKNIEITFGHDVVQAEDKTVSIYTQNSSTYTVSKDYDNKSITLTWFNKDEEGRPLGFTDGVFDNSTEKNEQNEELNKAIAGPSDDDTGIYYCVQLYRNSGNSEWEPCSDRTEPSEKDGIIKWNNLNCYTEFGYTEFKAIVYRNGIAYQSNIIKFTNSTLSVENINPFNLQLIINNGFNSQDAYPVYGSNNQYIGGLNGNRQISVSWNSIIGAQLDEDIFANAMLYWYLPNVATMLDFSSTNIIANVKDANGNMTSDSKNDDDIIIDNNAFIEITDVNDPMYKENYRCFKKTIKSVKTGTKDEDNFIFNYMIKKVFLASAKNNTIIVKIKDKNGNIYEGSKSFAFSSKGNSGTGYSLIIYHKDGFPGYIAEEMENASDYTDNLEAELYGPELNYIQDVTWSIGSDIDITTSSTYNIATATVNVQINTRDIELKTIYPIAWTRNRNYTYEGPVDIIYSSSGIDVEYYDGPLRVYDENFKEIKNLIWEIKYYKNGKNVPTTAVPNYIKDSLPTVEMVKIQDENDYYRLKVPTYYTKVEGYNVALIAKTNNTKWYQPLIINQFAYGFSVLNSWDGDLTIDEDNNRILAATIVAGEKNAQNQFTGIVMGQPGKLDSNEVVVADPIGLYGYSAGAQSFGFKEDGTAFIGKSGIGRINFEGNQGIIESANYIKEKTGSRWDLTNGEFYIGSEGNYINFDGSKLKIKADELVYTSVSQAGGNLLKNSQPESSEIGIYPWTSINGDSDRIQILYNESLKSYVFYVQEKDYNIIDRNQWWGIEQVVRLKPNTPYTVFSHLRHRTPGQEVLINISYYGLADKLDDNGNVEKDENNQVIRIRQAYDIKKGTWGTSATGDANGGWGTGTTLNKTRYGFSFTTPTEDELIANDGSGFYRICFYSRCQKERTYKFDENGAYTTLDQPENDNNTIFENKLAYKSMQVWKPCLLEGTYTDYIWQPEGINLNDLSTEIITEAGRAQTTVSATSQIYDYPEGVDGSKVLLYIDTIGTSPERQYPAAKYLNHYALNQSDNWLYYSDGQSWSIYEKDIKLITAELSSQIEQLPHKITLKVNNTENAGPSIQMGYKDENGNWVSAVDQTTDANAVIDLTGMVTFNSLKGNGTTVINGNNISTGVIHNDNNTMSINLNTGEIKVKNLEISTTPNLLRDSEPRWMFADQAASTQYINYTGSDWFSLNWVENDQYEDTIRATIQTANKAYDYYVQAAEDKLNEFGVKQHWGMSQEVYLEANTNYTLSTYLYNRVPYQTLKMSVYKGDKTSRDILEIDGKQAITGLQAGENSQWHFLHLLFTTQEKGTYTINFYTVCENTFNTIENFKKVDSNNNTFIAKRMRIWHPMLEKGHNNNPVWNASHESASFQILNNKISAKVENKYDGTAMGWDIKADNFKIYQKKNGTTTNVFEVNSNGNLYIKAANINITSASGTNNLLLNSEPRRPDSEGSYIKHWYKIPVGKGKIVVDSHSGTIYPHQFYTGVGENSTYGWTDEQIENGAYDKDGNTYPIEWGLRQTVTLAQNTQYTMQGWLKRKVKGQPLFLEVYFEDDNGSFTGNKLGSLNIQDNDASDGWAWYSYTFTTKENKSNGSYRQYMIRYRSNANSDNYGTTVAAKRENMSFRLWHPKLEEGAYASTWSASPSDYMSEFEILDDEISARIKSKDGTQSFGWQIDLNGFYIHEGSAPSPTNNVLAVDANGNLTIRGTIYASAGEFTGTITAESGKIGGWTINTSSISQSTTSSDGKTYTVTIANYDNTNDDSRVFHTTTGNTDTFYILRNGKVKCTNLIVTGGSINIGSGNTKFGLSNAGVLKCTGANISGIITANTGYIGGTNGWVITEGKLSIKPTALGDDWEIFLAANEETEICGRKDWWVFGAHNCGITISGEIIAKKSTMAGWNFGAFEYTGTKNEVTNSFTVGDHTASIEYVLEGNHQGVITLAHEGITWYNYAGGPIKTKRWVDILN